MNRWKFRRNTSRLILVLASLVTLIAIVITGVSSYAITPDAAYITKIEGTRIKIGERTSRDRTPASQKQQLRGNKVLYVPGNGSLAYLGFIVDAPLDTTGLLVSAGPSKTPSEWSFPCTAKGGFTIAWKDGSDRGCEAGVKVQSSSKKGGLPNNNLQASRKLLAQAEDEVTVVPTPGESTIQTADSAAGISINVLVGDVQVKSAKNPGGRLVKAGERYNYPQDTITPIDINPIVNSPEMQEFLNPDNWSSPNIPQRVADGIAGQLGEMRTALSQLPKQPVPQQPVASNPETPVSQPLTPSSPKTSQSVASNSGNNNPGNSGRTTPRDSQTNKIPSLVGTWEAQITDNQYQMQVTWNSAANRYEGILTKQGQASQYVGFSIGELVWTATVSYDSNNNVSIQASQKYRWGSNGVSSGFQWFNHIVNLNASTADILVTSAPPRLERYGVTVFHRVGSR